MHGLASILGQIVAGLAVAIMVAIAEAMRRWANGVRREIRSARDDLAGQMDAIAARLSAVVERVDDQGERVSWLEGVVAPPGTLWKRPGPARRVAGPERS